MNMLDNALKGLALAPHHTLTRYAAICAAHSDLGRHEGPEAYNLMHASGRSIVEYWMWAEDPPGWEDWCAASVSHWIRRGLGLPDWSEAGYAPKIEGHPFGQWLVGVGQIHDFAEKNDAYMDHPEPGCIFLEGRKHTGLVAYLNDDGKHVHTIEGNYMDQVATVARRIGSLRFVRWWAR